MTDEHRTDADELAFLASYDPSEFPHPSVAVDIVIATAIGGALHAVLVRRDEHPALGRWALPGGFVGLRESLENAAERVLAAKAGLADVFLEQLYTFGAPDRDARTRVISVAYYALVEPARLHAISADGDAVRLAPLAVAWSGEEGGTAEALAPDGSALPLAFDHADILGLVVQRLRGKLDYAALGFELLPELFTLRQLQDVHETILGRPLNKDSFRRRMLASGLVTPTGLREQDVLHRPAELHRFTPESDRRS